MRNCPVCNSGNRTVLWRSDFVVPDGWTRPKYLDWCRCECGMIYGDNPLITQADYDKYYQERYGYGVSDFEQELRLIHHAEWVKNNVRDKQVNIVDFGGGREGLCDLLDRFGYLNTHTVEAGESVPENVDIMFAEMVLEHIYDMDSAMAMIAGAVRQNGKLIVDVPDAGAVAFGRSESMPMLDYHQPHINHFRVIDVLKLMQTWGFELVETNSYVERNLPCRRFVFVKDIESVGRISKWIVNRNMDEKIEKLIKLGDKPVCLWGLGDIASFVLARHWPNLQYFISNDPAFKGATIRGLPVYEAPIDHSPILLIAQAQKQRLLERIRSECINEIIEI